MVATLALLELQWLFKLTSCVVASLNVPVAVNCWVVPTPIVGLMGEMATDTKVPLPITSEAVPLIPESDAVMVTVPARFPWAMPLERTDANCGFEDFHDTPTKVATVLPSLYLPLAVNFIEVPLAMCALGGFTVIEVSFAVETVKPVEPLTAPELAEIVALPAAALVTNP